MPFKSRKQQKKCYALKARNQAGSWDCDEWADHTNFKKLSAELDSIGPYAADRAAVVHGADAIIAYLDERHPEPVDAARHRAQMRVEWPHWVALEGR